MTYSASVPDWKETTLGEAGKWFSGGTPSTSVAAYWNGETPWITSSSMHNFYINDSDRRVTQEGIKNGTRLMPKNTILFVVRGMSLKSEFRVGITQRPVAFGQDCKAIVANKDIDPLFLANAIRAKSEEILGLVDEASHGTGRLQTSALQQLIIPLPPLPEQRAIASILGSLDDKIELNRQMNATLEEMARALFKSWFVDFDPVHAKARGENPVGMDAATAALFPDSFEKSELGPIPSGWGVESLEQHFEVARGLSYKGSGLAEQGIPLHNLNSVYEGGSYKNEGIKYYTGEYQERHIIKPGELIIANTEQGFEQLLIGYPALVPKRFGEWGLFSHHIYRIRPLQQSPLTNLFFYFQLKRPSYHQLVAGYANGTTVNMLPIDGLQKPLIIVPLRELIQVFDKFAAPLLEKIETNLDESRTLAELRDTLLPKLMSGEVRVPELKEFEEQFS